MQKKSKTLVETIREKVQSDKERTERLLHGITSQVYNTTDLSMVNLRNADVFRKGVEIVYEMVSEGKSLEKLTGNIFSDKKRGEQSNEEDKQIKTRAKRYLTKGEAIAYCQKLDDKAGKEMITRNGYRQRINLGIEDKKIEIRKEDGLIRSRDVRIWNKKY